MRHHRSGVERLARELARQAEERELDVDKAILAMDGQDPDATEEFLRSIREMAEAELQQVAKGSA